jgi:hypothetical protein
MDQKNKIELEEEKELKALTKTENENNDVNLRNKFETDKVTPKKFENYNNEQGRRGEEERRKVLPVLLILLVFVILFILVFPLAFLIHLAFLILFAFLIPEEEKRKEEERRREEEEEENYDTYRTEPAPYTIKEKFYVKLCFECLSRCLLCGKEHPVINQSFYTHKECTPRQQSFYRSCFVCKARGIQLYSRFFAQRLCFNCSNNIKTYECFICRQKFHDEEFY